MRKIITNKGREGNQGLSEVLFLNKPKTLEKIQCLAVVGPGDWNFCLQMG
jgi:hypothetical protein